MCGMGEKRDNALITVGPGESVRNRILAAAEQRLDEGMQMLIKEYSSLVGVKYHRRCYCPYISARNIESTRRKHDADTAGSESKKAFARLTKELEESAFNNEKNVILLSSLCQKYNEILHESDSEKGNYSSWKLKEKLKKYFGDRLVFLPRTGLSDVVCSRELTVGQLCEKAEAIWDWEKTNTSQELILSDKDILHRAAGILRACLRTDKSTAKKTYFSCKAMSADFCTKFIPEHLYEFVSWCCNEKHYSNASNIEDITDSKNNLAVVAVFHQIIAISEKVLTPVTLGLGVHLHHEFGSKKLLDVLNSLGMTVTYDEVRRFSTSVATEQLAQNEGLNIPRGIQNIISGFYETYVDAAIDNFDQNEETVDGKNTTHSLATVLFQRTASSTNNEENPIPRLSKKALSTSDYELKIRRYRPPHKRPEPFSVSSASVVTVKEDDKTYETAKQTDFSWELARIHEKEKIPDWGTFNSKLSANDVPIATVHYLPFIHAPPSDMSTIYTALVKLVEISHRLGQSHILVTADLAIYSKAQEILWSKPAALNGNVTMRLGGMHLAMAFIASVGKLFGDGGLLHVLTESGVYAETTARQMLEGKQLSRASRGLKLVLEALSHLQMKALRSWMAENEHDWISAECAQNFALLGACFSEEKFDSAKTLCSRLEPEVSRCFVFLKQFRMLGRTQSATFAFWDSLLEAIHVFLRLMRAERNADYHLHLTAVSETIPYFLVSGRHNYAKFAPVYVSEMRQLEIENPDAFNFLQSGGFVVRRSSLRGFNCVSTDQALEQTVNRDAKSTGGVVGFTMRKGALQRWLLTRHVTGEYSDCFQSMCLTTEYQDTPLYSASTKKDSAEVERLMTYVSERQNPFEVASVPKELINIVTGKVANSEIEKALTTLESNGQQKLKSFMESRLVDGIKTKSFWDPQTRGTVATFADMKLLRI
jgi:hypothetical protein